MSTDPFIQHDPLICGISLSTEDPFSCAEYGSIGCFVTVNGIAAAVHPINPALNTVAVAAGNYLLTCNHVVVAAKYPPQDHVVQPGRISASEINANVIGTYVAGYDNLSVGVDAALVHVVGREMLNAIPEAPWVPGRRIVDTIGTAAVGDRVYKFGATTGHTTGVVRNINWSSPDGSIVNAILVEGEGTEAWVNSGDSGSIVVRYSDNAVVGMNFRVDNSTGNKLIGFTKGFAFDLSAQLAYFGGGTL